ncbi:MAG: cytochrome c oxidase subunit II [Deltaproteobacteria bacterium]|nr:cytochrome c oxidase subunit II [Deltaproteobacteria bacterium]
MLLSLFLFPPQASTNAPEVDALYLFLVALCGLTALGVITAMTFFAIRYRRTPENVVGHDIHGSTALEIFWTAIPFLILMFVFAWGASLYFKLSRPPEDAMEVFVVGRQWMWKIQHMEGRREINALHVPVGRPIKLTMTSEDVIHSFYIPAFRVKADVVPGRYTTLWFQPTKPGEYHLFCAEYCGTEHSRMGGSVIVMQPAEYEAWLAGTQTAGGGTPSSGLTPVQLGRKLFVEKACATCHLNTPGGVGPVLVGIYGRQVELATGATVKVDEAYVRESILTPMAKVVKGFPPAMPTFGGQLTEEQVMSLIAYVKSLSDGGDAAAPAPHSGAAPAAPTAPGAPAN